MNPRATLLLPVLLAATGAQAQACKDNFQSSGNFLTGNSYKTQAPLPGVAMAHAFQRALQFTVENGFTLLNSNPQLGQISAAQSAQLAKGKQVPLNIVVREEGDGAVLTLNYTLGPGQMSPEAAIREHFCKTIAAAASGPAPAAPVAKAVQSAAPAAVAAGELWPGASSAAAEHFRAGQPCMSGLCIGDDIAQATHIRWEPWDPNLSDARRRMPPSKGWLDTAASTVKGTRAAQEAIASGLTNFSYDGPGLAALKGVQAVCAPLPGGDPAAYFKSASGHVTKVEFVPTAGASGKTVFRVRTLSRIYRNALSAAQQKEVLEASYAQYLPLLKAHETLRGNPEPRWPSYSTSTSALGVHVMLLEASAQSWNRKDGLLSQAACGGAAKVSLE